MSRNTRRPDPAAAVARWNATVKVGDTVEYIEHDCGGATPRRFTTRTEAEVLSGHTAVVWLNGKSGCVAISHCTPVPATPASVRKNPVSVQIFEEGLLPPDYLREIPARYEADKRLIKQAIEDGHDVPGAKLTRTESLQIK